MVTSALDDVVTAAPPRSRRGRWLAAVIVVGLVAVYLAAVRSTSTTLRASGSSQWGTSGQAAIGLRVHNGGPVPVTLLSVAAARPDLTLVAELGPGGVASASSGRMRPFHPVTVGPGDTVDAALTERVICTPATCQGVTSASKSGQFETYGEATSTVVVRYRVLGVTMSRTFRPVPSQPAPGGSPSPSSR